ncbi:MAG: class I SAM-dependent methyltransferase [Candidatus Scalindua sp. AMX11]|nr:MAG: class I SAM-dependent methyltransferase [Candidatus Scalindua sp.]NOG84124.1 class I SAM-dependent methyltransferase [Planctomycetota bacterium]RZV98966.1 MAG: class I SAM-dependent methyltransferase [Candidatus Scalindua sp. SCAELEC01]TDE66842.1 MAG: class I SAM-dependent methyltransferase [Candidatus Scalindua sp. AMX11]GJQ57641.1 MAG: hypothetical protein SCALA701_04420 [Candidatus Scalindua sp.]
MKEDKQHNNQKDFWEYAGSVGYDKAQFSSALVASHILTKQSQTAMRVAEVLGLTKSAKILELGCGDGTFAENILSTHFKHVDAFEISKSAIAQAKVNSTSPNVHFYAKDITKYEFEADSFWDGAFLIGILHHIREYTPKVVSHLAKVCPKVIVLEPNGDNILRKGLELLPSYKRAGEESFKLRNLINTFNVEGYTMKVNMRINFLPQFLPEKLFHLFNKLENTIEQNIVLNRLCATYVLGFERIVTS